MKKTKAAEGFTLIELLVVIAIIGVLASIVLASLGVARAKARDARRKEDLTQIRSALYLYYDNHKNYVENGSGCGWLGDGYGWFNYAGVSYPKSGVQCLIEDGALSAEIIDPTGGRNGGHAYMKYQCGTPTNVYIYARLEGEAESSTATDGTCCPTCDSNYGMNYYVKI